MSTLPPEIRDASAWYGPELGRQTDWIVRLSDAEIAELEEVVARLNNTDIEDLTSLNPHDVPLPTLGKRLQRLLNDDVLTGRGFVLIKSLPVERWTKRGAAIAFLVSIAIDVIGVICG